MVTLLNYALLSNSFIEHNRWRGENIVSCLLSVVYSDVHCSGLNLETHSDLCKGYCFLCCVEWKGGGSVWPEEIIFFLSNLYLKMGSAGDCLWVDSVQQAHSRLTQSKWSVFWLPEWTSDPPLLASGCFFFCFWKVNLLVMKFGVNFFSACVWKSLFPVLWNYPGIILQCHVVAWFLSSLLGPKG